MRFPYISPFSGESDPALPVQGQVIVLRSDRNEKIKFIQLVGLASAFLRGRASCPDLGDILLAHCEVNLDAPQLLVHLQCTLALVVGARVPFLARAALALIPLFAVFILDVASVAMVGSVGNLQTLIDMSGWYDAGRQ